MKKFLGLTGLQEVVDKIKTLINNSNAKIDSHISNVSNPHKVSKGQIGLSNVENKSSATIRSEITKQNVVDGLGYTPSTKDTTYSLSKSGSIITLTGSDGTKTTVTDSDTVYSHPSSHSASMITQDSTHRFVSDSEKSTWNGKANSSHTHTKSQISDFPSSLPANGGTATNANNILQTAVDASSYTNWRSLVWGASNGSEGFTPATSTGQLYSSGNISFQPSTGILKTNVFKGSLSGNASSASSVPWSGVSGKPSSMPASDVYSWAKASSKPTYTKSEVGLSNVDNTADGSKNVSSAGFIRDSNNGNKIAISYQDPEVTTGTWFPIYVNSSKIGTIKASNIKNVIGLGSVNNTADSEKSVKYATSAGSASSATTASKLGTASKGSATQPVYLNAGVPTACTYTLGKSVPSNAVFTDTNTWIALKGATTTAAGTAGYVPAPSAGAANRYLRSDGTWAVPPNTTYSLGSFGITATAAELNYCDGVTSNIQTQLNGKAASSHSHNYAAASHTHDDRYYTESEVNSKLSGKSNTGHSHAVVQSSEPSGQAVGDLWFKE